MRRRDPGRPPELRAARRPASNDFDGGDILLMENAGTADLFDAVKRIIGRSVELLAKLRQVNHQLKLRGQPGHNAQAVFDTTELLERILSFVPNKDLMLSAQATCRRVREVVDSSPKLQKKLFFVPKQRNPKPWALHSDNLLELEPKNPSNGPLHPEKRWIVQLNHYVFELADANAFAAIAAIDGIDDLIRFLDPAIVQVRDAGKLVGRDLDSILNHADMYITHPPIPEVHVVWITTPKDWNGGPKVGGEYSFCFYQIANATGVTLQDIARSLARLRYHSWVDFSRSYIFLLGTYCVSKSDWRMLMAKEVHRYKKVPGNGNGNIEISFKRKERAA